MRKMVRLLACATLLTVTTSAYAGARQGVGVSVSASQVVGCVGGARASADVLQRIYCRLVTYPSGNASAYCYGFDAAGKYGACYTEVPDLMERVSTLRSTSVVLFSWDGNGRCTNIYVNNNSYCDPKPHS